MGTSKQPLRLRIPIRLRMPLRGLRVLAAAACLHVVAGGGPHSAWLDARAYETSESDAPWQGAPRKSPQVLCGEGYVNSPGSNTPRTTCGPVVNFAVSDFMATGGESVEVVPEGGCFLTQTHYADNGFGNCQYLKLYGNDVITYSTGGVYQYGDDVSYVAGGGGGNGHSHSQGPGSDDFYAVRRRTNAADEDTGYTHAFDYYELRKGLYRFGYYNCTKIVEGGAIDDFTQHYECSSGVDLFQGCMDVCAPSGGAGLMADMRAFNFTSSMFGSPLESYTSTVFT